MASPWDVRTMRSAESVSPTCPRLSVTLVRVRWKLLAIFSPVEAHPPLGKRKSRAPKSTIIVPVIGVIAIFIVRQDIGVPFPAGGLGCNILLTRNRVYRLLLPSAVALVVI